MKPILQIVKPEYTTRESESGIIFTILDGHFKNIEFIFGTVSIAEPEKGQDDAVLSFTYAIVTDENNLSTGDDIVDFRLTLGKILEVVISGLTEETTNEEIDINTIDEEVSKVYN